MTLALILCLASVAPADDWLLVRGAGDGVGDLSWQQIGEAYLSRWNWSVVDATGAERDPVTSRLMAGAAGEHPALAALFRDLQLELVDGALNYAGFLVPVGVGLVLVQDDPDGQGLLVAFTGVDDDSAFQGFTINVDVTRPGVTFVRGGRKVSPRSLSSFDTRAIEVVPLDVLWWTGGAWNPERTVMDRALAVARALDGYRFVYEAATIPEIDLLAFAAELLTVQPDAVEAATALGFHHDAIESGRQREAQLAEVLGPRSGPHPVVYTLVGHPLGTNAKTFGSDPITGRPSVLLNLSAFAGPADLDAALMHELVHTRQPAAGPRLVDRIVHEGVACAFVAALEPADDALALMWSEAALAAATEHHDEIVAALRGLAEETDPALHAPWITLHVRPDGHPGLPDRAGYYVGYRAVLAWLAADEDRELRDLLDVDAAEVLAALE